MDSSPNMPPISIDPPCSAAERRRRGRGVDTMSAMPTPERPKQHLPTPVAQRRRPDDIALSDHTGVHLPTPQTLPRKRASPRTDDPSSPSGRTQFFFAQSAEHAEHAERVTVPPRRRPGLMFAQQMGLTQTGETSEIKFGARLGVGVGMGGTMRNTHGPVDKVTPIEPHDDNPFLVQSSFRTSNPLPASTSRPIPPAPGTDTSYVPQAVRPSAERSVSPHPRRHPRPLAPNELTTEARRRRAMMDEDNPFIAKPGEVVRPRPTREDKPHVTYVFRGSKKVFANPFFAPETAYPPSQLDPKDPDFDPHPCPKPRLLFPTPASPEPSAPGAEMRPRGKRTLADYQSMDMDAGPSDDDDDEDVPRDFVDSESDEELPLRRGMLFGPGGMKRDVETPEAKARKRARA